MDRIIEAFTKSRYERSAIDDLIMSACVLLLAVIVGAIYVGVRVWLEEKRERKRR